MANAISITQSKDVTFHHVIDKLRSLSSVMLIEIIRNVLLMIAIYVLLTEVFAIYIVVTEDVFILIVLTMLCVKVGIAENMVSKTTVLLKDALVTPNLMVTVYDTDKK
jgi:hypothetical protein